MSTDSFWRFDTSQTTVVNDHIVPEVPAEDANPDDYSRGMATVAILFDMVDIGRLITTRDRIFPLSNTGVFANIPTQVAYREYLRFLTIKILTVNVPALALSPSWYIDQLWHSHILDTEPYAQLRERWPGRLQHDPVPAGSDENQKNRLKQTLAVYEKLFRESPLRNTATGAIWSPTNINSVPAQPITPTNINSIPAQPTTPTNINSVPAQPIIPRLPAVNAEILPPPSTKLSPFRVNVVQLSGRTISLACSKTTTIKEIKTRYRQQLGGRRPALGTLRVIFEGSRLDETRTLGYYDIKSGDTLKMVREQVGC